LNSDHNKSVLDELSSFDIDVSNLHLVVLVDDSAKLINNVGIKLSPTINYVVVYYSTSYFIMSTQFYKKHYKHMKDSYEVYRTIGETLIGLDVVNNFNKY